jgi:hypothetical protein
MMVTIRLAWFISSPEFKMATDEVAALRGMHMEISSLHAYGVDLSAAGIDASSDIPSELLEIIKRIASTGTLK